MADTTTQQDKTVEEILQEMEQERQSSATPSFPNSIINPPTPARQQLFDDSTMAIYQDAMMPIMNTGSLVLNIAKKYLPGSFIPPN